MKTKRLQYRSSLAALCTVSLLCVAEFAQAQVSPVGTWDVVMGGQRRGTAQITFNGDFTLNGFEIFTSPTPKVSTSVDPRTGTLDPPLVNTDPRTGQIEPTGNASELGPKPFGGADFTGTWSFDRVGRVIGFYAEVSVVSMGGTNVVVTNGISFKATVTPARNPNNNSINASARGPVETFTLRGKTLIPLASIGGSYYGKLIRDNVASLEFFSLSPGAELNTYDVVGTGPDYSYTGMAMYSRLNQLSILSRRDGTNSLTSINGSFNAKKSPPRGTLKGQQGAEGDARRVTFQINP